MTDVTMPQLGETVTEGTITRWNKAVGDEVAEDEVLFEVSTDKVDSEVPSPASGTLTEIKIQEGETAEVGTVLCVIGEGGASDGGDQSAEPEEAEPEEAEPEGAEPEETDDGETDETPSADEEEADASPAAPVPAATGKTASKDSPSDDGDTYDVVIIGGGPGGYAAALYGAASGLKIAMVEKDKVGGTCLQRGCIPAKAFLETASVYRTVAHEAKQHGITSDNPSIDFEQAQARKQKIVDGLTKGLTGTLKGRKITVVGGTATLHPDKVVKVDDGTVLKGRHIVLATGGEPKTFGDFKIDGATVVTSNEVLSMTALPSRVAIVGGGIIGCEFASMMCDLGSEVTILEGLPTILNGLDKDVAATVKRALTKRGIKVIENAKVQTHEPRPEGGTVVKYNEGESVEVDAVVMCVGRGPLTRDVLADGTGVELDKRGFIKVTETMRTTADGVWAVGDCVPTPWLAHVAFAEAILAIHDMLGEEARPIDYDKVPCCVYTHPEAAWAGLTEAQAKEKGYDVVIEKMRWMGNSRALIHGDTDGMVKIIAEKNADGTAGVILGVHMAGPWVTEQLGQAYLSVNWEATVDDVASLIQPHPTLSEVFGEAVMVLTGRGLHG